MYSPHCLYKDKPRKLKMDKENTIQIKSKLQLVRLNLFRISTIKRLDNKQSILTKDLLYFAV